MSALAKAPRVAPLVRYDAMCVAIEAAYKVDEVKPIRDEAIALETYARQAHNVEAERQACEIRLRAERKAGELSAKLEKSAGGRPSKTPPMMGRVSTKAEQLKAAGVTPKQAEQWEKLAAIPEREFKQALADKTTMPTTNGIIRASAPAKPRVHPDALWLWGRLRDFERDGLLDKTTADVLETMTPEMLDDTHKLAPRVAKWLSKIGR
jgi:transcriptional regulator with XRE-family HTH domain